MTYRAARHPHSNVVFAGCSSRLRHVHVPSPAVCCCADSCSSVAPNGKFDDDSEPRYSSPAVDLVERNPGR